MTDLAALGFQVDSRPLDAGTASLDRFSAAARPAEEATRRFNATGAAAADPLRALTGHMNDNTHAVGLNRIQIMEVTHVLRSMTEMIIAGQSPMRALMLEGGRINQIFQSGSGGAGGALKAFASTLGGMITPARLAIGALSAIPTAGFAAWSAWEDRMQRMQSALNGIGRASGMTLSGLASVGASAGQRNQFSIAQGQDLAAQFAGAGFNASQTETLIGSTRRYSRAFGTSPDEAGKLLSGLSNPASGASELNKKLGFMTGALQGNIERLMAENNLRGAQNSAIESVNKATAQMTDRMSFFTKAWESATNAMSNWTSKAGKKVDELFTGIPLEKQAEQLRTHIAALKSGGGQNLINQPFTPGFDKFAAPGGSKFPTLSDFAPAAVEMTDDARKKQTVIAERQLAIINQQLAGEIELAAVREKESELNLKSIRARQTVLDAIPEIKDREALASSILALKDMVAQTDRMGISSHVAKEALAAVEARLVAFKDPLEKIKQETEFAAAAARADTMAERTKNQAMQEFGNVMTQTGREALAAAASQKVYTVALAESDRILKDAGRDVNNQYRLAGLRPGEARAEERRQYEDRLRSGTVGGRLAGQSTGAGATGVSPMSILEGQLGTGSAGIQGFLGAGGQTLAARFYAWCAAAINSSLEQAGVRGSGSNMARSLLNVGSPVDAENRRRGDIVVLSRAAGGPGAGHTGFYDRDNGDGTIRVLGGNTGGRVGYGNFASGNVLGYRRVGDGASPIAANDNRESTISALGKKFEDTKKKGPTDDLFHGAEDSIAAQTAAIDKQIQTITMSTSAIARANEETKIRNDLIRLQIPIDEELEKRIKAVGDAEEERAKKEVGLKEMTKDLDDARGAAKGFVSDFVNGLAHGKNGAEALRGALQGLGQKILNMGLDKLTTGLFGGGAAGGGGILGSLFGGGAAGGGLFSGIGKLFGGSIGQNAEGTDNWSGGATWVGEKGPEVVNLPRGSSVTPNNKLGGNVVHIGGPSINVQGSVTQDVMPQVHAAIAAGQKQTVEAVQRNFGGMSTTYQQRHG